MMMMTKIRIWRFHRHRISALTYDRNNIGCRHVHHEATQTRRRVVVTGMGAMSPLGNTFVESWNNLLDQKSGVTTLEQALVNHQNLSPEQLDFEWKIAQKLPCQVAAPVQNLPQDPRTARFVQMTLFAGEEAMKQAQLAKIIDDDKYSSTTHRMGVSVGSGMSGVREITQSLSTISANVDNVNIRKLSPHFIPKVLTNSAAGRLSLEFGLKGPNLAPSTACAAGSHAIGDAFRAIQYGTADVMLAGGAEASIEPLGMAGFCRLRALSTGFNNSTEQASRPFDKRRDGFVMGEGAAILVLEELEHAKQRGVPILAEVCGYGISGDAFHITAPDEQGWGAERAMKMALEDATRLHCEHPENVKVGYINAHATSTPKGDEIEAMVIDRVLRSISDAAAHNTTYVSSTKGATGHLLGAAGALEAAFTVQCLVAQTLPPTLNLEDPDEKLDQDQCFEHIQLNSLKGSIEIDAAMSNSFGFGGTNASLLFRRYHN
ncbi:3-oxoacyl-synthase [Nitzschia inconspicua]|uniref:beta-ketoacyl-[acyl-carrier-protein] synthase I n=1 Tax=Nitzschia inconspicua TaxID=303405 RepID=A0A9K3KM07_9STRA|nr:3-oxoacyl-synthase [Nitzschia inconspicua]